jgi:hypothetical protein
MRLPALSANHVDLYVCLLIPPERLAEKRYVTLQLRVLVDIQGNLVQGVVGGTSVDRSVERWVRFRGATGLTGALRSWLAGDPELQPRTNCH